MKSPKWLQDLQEKRKIKEQERLLEALKRPETQRRRPAAKFAMNKVRTK